MDPSTSPSKSSSSNSRHAAIPTTSYLTNSYRTKSPPISPQYPPTSSVGHYTIPPSHSPPNSQSQQAYSHYDTAANGGYHGSQRSQRRGSYNQGGGPAPSELYNPMAYPYQTPVSPPPSQQFYPQVSGQHGYPPHPQHQQGQYMPQGYVPHRRLLVHHPAHNRLFRTQLARILLVPVAMPMILDRGSTPAVNSRLSMILGQG